ncbi:hypothetical protein D3C76_831660 [compost metagenome]
MLQLPVECEQFLRMILQFLSLYLQFFRLHLKLLGLYLQFFIHGLRFVIQLLNFHTCQNRIQGHPHHFQQFIKQLKMIRSPFGK